VGIDFTKGNPVQMINEHRASSRQRKQGLRPGEEKMAGVNCAIDAVGYQAISQRDPRKEDPTQTIRDIAEMVNPSGLGRLDRGLLR
jgi:glutathione-independent formaldehyde dehydrogenase